MRKTPRARSLSFFLASSALFTILALPAYLVDKSPIQILDEAAYVLEVRALRKAIQWGLLPERVHVSDQIALVGIHGSDLAEYGGMRRKILADILNKASRLRVKGVFLDFFLSEERPGEDAALVRAACRLKSIGADLLVLRDLAAGSSGPFRALAPCVSESAHAAVEASGKWVTEVPLFLNIEGEFYPHAALAVFSKAAGEARVEPGANGIRAGKRFFGTDARYRMRLNFLSRVDPTPSTAAQFLKTDDSGYAGKWILVGMTAPGFGEEFFTPLDTLRGNTLYGVEITGLALDTLLSGAPIEPVRLPMEVLLILLPAGLVVWLLERLSWKGGLGMSVLVLGGSAAVLLWGLYSGTWARPVPVLANLTGCAVVALGIRYRDEAAKRERVESVFARYVTKPVLCEILKNQESFEHHLLGERRRVTILESDIRSFTRLSEGKDPQEIMDLLRRYFSLMIPLLQKWNGQYDKFIGDALLAYFGAPIAVEKHAEHAVQCAQEMIDLVEEKSRAGELPFRIGIGIHTGEVAVGEIGHAEIRQYTIIGDAVNVAARLCGLAPAGSLVLSEETRNELGSSFHGDPTDTVQVKGRETPLRIYTLNRSLEGSP